MRDLLRSFPGARAAVRFFYEYRGLRVLPPRVAVFRFRVQCLAKRRGDDWALRSAAPPGSLANLLRVAEGCRHVVELGTATGWTTAAFVLSDPRRTVTSYDPEVHDG